MVKRINRYVAFDGKEFEREEQAVAHESSLLEPCALCGGRALYRRSEPNESTYNGCAYVYCESCRFSIDCEPNEVRGLVLPAGSTSWDYIYASLDVAGERVRNQWNKLMYRPTPKPDAKPAKEPEPEVIEYKYQEVDMLDNKDRVWKKES